ncbi:hypothetical protein POM88_027263 [Heracleum sosnowskyi]|uniref:THIF-type NAD/FAD binding fold domain-containing protein n=1 Tax=Heracleum sosnowskyi TaxID=360622 RepID=A0AAD8I8N1_9APIA|nr:hypothetical protein POM88_027263 [Heracleum sosnowskyi]
MDSTLLAVSAADLNLKLMKWRVLPSLDLTTLSATKCLLVGAGTLGFQVARLLMVSVRFIIKFDLNVVLQIFKRNGLQAWGVRKITLVDSGKLRHGSGPLSHYRAESVSALSAKMEISPLADKDRMPRLGCSFCSDDVAPIDSTSNRTLDEKCTVTRPGLAPIASALAVELLVGILHHPHRTANAMDSESMDQSLGIVPHQIQGSLSQFSQETPSGHSKSGCTACCCTDRNSEFDTRMYVLHLHLSPCNGDLICFPLNICYSYGLTELKKVANLFSDLALKNTMSATKCLLLGAGTLGCQVARMLMSLYTFKDSLNLKCGKDKALAAVKRLKKIFPDVEAEGIKMDIPMPGHPVPNENEHDVLENCRRLQDLIDSHDAVFLLTDTRESNWLPTLLWI